LILYCDEGIDRGIVDALRSDGHVVTYVAELAPGITDEQVLADANRLGALLVTRDKDFGELVFRQRRLHTGILLLRVEGLAREQKAQLVCSSVQAHGSEMCGAFAVLTRDRLRIRPQSRT
jgi:predicted nuclease of predicted toxin-antitoxin system